MNVAETLALWGVRHVDDVLDAAQLAGLSLPLAAALLDQETGGGANVWGSDGVSTGGAYVKGAEVTEASYRAYATLRDAGLIGNQGVGPVQLTSTSFQREADAIGGCWIPRHNMVVGFRLLAGLVRQYGDDGIRRYNGSGPDAERYRDQMLSKIQTWNIILSGSTPVELTKQDRSPARGDDDVMMNINMQVDGNGYFRGAAICEAGSSSKVITQAWAVFGVLWGTAAGNAAEFRIAFLGGDGLVMGPDAEHADVLPNNGRYSMAAPSGCAMVTVEGRVYGTGAVPTAALITKSA